MRFCTMIRLPDCCRYIWCSRVIFQCVLRCPPCRSGKQSSVATIPQIVLTSKFFFEFRYCLQCMTATPLFNKQMEMIEHQAEWDYIQVILPDNAAQWCQKNKFVFWPIKNTLSVNGLGIEMNRHACRINSLCHVVFNVLVFFEFTKLLAIEQIFFLFTGLFVDSAAWSADGWREWRAGEQCDLESRWVASVKIERFVLCGRICDWLMRHIFGAPSKTLSINNIAIFRVTKIQTLKMA